MELLSQFVSMRRAQLSDNTRNSERDSNYSSRAQCTDMKDVGVRMKDEGCRKPGEQIEKIGQEPEHL